MQILNLLEKLATHTRFETDFGNILSTQPDEIKELFLTNNSNSLKSLFPHAAISADRTTIFQI